MSPRLHPRAVTTDRQSRRREVERVLAEAGLARGPRGLHQAAPAAEALSGRRLAQALARLGGVWSAFGRYLGTRVDLLPAVDCRELASLPDQAPAVPVEVFRAWLEAELGAEAIAEVVEIAAEPKRSDLWFQSHGGRLASGEAVLLRLVRPELEASLELELPMLDLLQPAFAAAGWNKELLTEARGGFARHLETSLDLAHELENLEALAEDFEEFPFFTVPAAVRPLCSRRCLTLADPGGTDLESTVSGSAPQGAAANRLTTIWLRQALNGRAFPTEPRGGNVLRLPDGRLALVGGNFSRPSAKAQASFRAFLVAISRRDADEALRHFCQEWVPEGQGADLTALRSRLRQAVPFREGSWGEQSEALAEHLFLAWRFARQCGLAPRREMLDLIRGCAAAHAAALAQGVEGDPLLSALGDLRLASSFENFAELASFERVSEDFERYALLFAELPQKLDAALSRGAGADQEQGRPSARHPRRTGSTRPALVAALILALAALFLLARPLSVALGEKSLFLVVLVVGGFLLGAAARGGR